LTGLTQERGLFDPELAEKTCPAFLTTLALLILMDPT
jgi:hypothetical protein